MMNSYTYSDAQTFTRTHASHISAKVATDLKRMQRFYGSPSDREIAMYEEELIEFLKEGYVKSVIYGFQRNGSWIEPTLFYEARDILEANANSDDPGRLFPGADIRKAIFNSYLFYSSLWACLTLAQKENFNKRLPFSRSEAPNPSISGYLSSDLIYSAGGRSLERMTLRSY